MNLKLQTSPEKDFYENLLKNKKPSHIDYELILLLEQGLRGFPIVKALESLHAKASDTLSLKIEQHLQKAPFLTLIPLFAFQVPSLILIFLFPLISNFLKELN